jgi:HEAT repeat protein
MKGELALLDPDPIVRLRAVDDVPFDATGLYALRDRLLDDRNGFVRAAVAERLSRAARAIFDENSPTRAEAMLWLIDALADSLGSVRELVCRAIVRHGERGAELETRLAELLARDPLWRVRRAAARALAAVAGPLAIPTLITGLEDPFWRVRQGVIEALSLIVTRSSADEDEQARLRAQVLNAGAGLDEAARAALAYLAGGWPEGEAEVPAVLGIIRDPGAGLELVDADPAVVTARLLAARWVEPDKLVPLLAESHVPLREEAARRLAGVEDPSCLIPALAWLEDPRLPNAPAAVRTLLDRLGSRAGVLAEHALVRGRPGALAWAASWVATNAAEHLHASLLEHVGHPSAEVRAAVVAALGRIAARDPEDRDIACELIERGLQDPARAVRDAAALALLELRVVPDARAFSSLSASVRAAIVGQGASEACELALRDEHPDVRAAAITVANAQSRALGLADPDPRVRRVALDLTAACECMLGDHEHDPELRRAAARLLVRELDAIDRAQLPALRARMYEDDDPWLRARASELVDPRDCSDDAFAQLLCATRDTEAMARASAAAQLDAVLDLRERLERVLAEDGPRERQIAAWSRLITLSMGTDVEAAQARLEQGLVTSTDAEITAHLRELAVLFGADPPARAPVRAPAVFTPRERPDAPSTPIAARALGRSGIELAPLVVSGRFSPTPSSLALALEHGVDTLFWEPTYTTTTRFLRQPRSRRVQVIAGSFHADRAGLTHDLEQARRRLEREHIDVFLLFWVRSVARIGAEALDTLREFQARGWIRSYGFSTHDRAIACAAIETGDWPVIMTRHSAAHDGAERELLPAAAAAGVGVLGFSALCYGRMLQPSSVFESSPAAADCYRYSLSQPAVAACISAPQRNRELLENLDVLARPTLDPLLQEALRAHGREVYADSKRFDRLLRRGGAAPLREAILELFERACEPPEPYGGVTGPRQP